MKEIKTNTYVLFTISILVIYVSAMGLFIPDFYHNRMNEITVFEIMGQDIVSLIIGGLFLITLIAARHIKASSVIWCGFIIYIAYTYAYFSFGLLNSRFTLLYYFITGLSFYSLIGILLRIQKESSYSGKAYHAKAVSVYLIIVAGVMTCIECIDIAGKTIFSNAYMTPKDAYYILDLVFLFPAMAIASVLNAKRNYSGVFFSGAFLIKTIALMPALILSDCIHYANNGFFVDLDFDVVAAVILISALVFWNIYRKGILLDNEVSALSRFPGYTQS